MRAFIALELPAEIKMELGQIQKRLGCAGIQARWVKPEISHLTLAFLGQTPAEKIPLVGQSGSIKLQLGQLGCFPQPARAKIIFVDLQGELNKLNALVFRIRSELKKAKIAFDEKPFVPHLTLGRLKKPSNLETIIKKIKVEKSEFTANQVSLIKSTLTSSGPIYETCRSFLLAPEAKK